MYVCVCAYWFPFMHYASFMFPRSIEVQNLPNTKEEEKINEEWWNLYDNIWNIISAMNGKGSNKMLPKSSPAAITTFGQRARGLVESLNIPAAEMAAVVVSGGIGNALAGKPNKPVDKAMLLRGEKCPKIVFRLMILYLCKSSLERASRCVQQVIPLLPCLLTADDEQSKSRLQLFIWYRIFTILIFKRSFIWVPLFLCATLSIGDYLSEYVTWN